MPVDHRQQEIEYDDIGPRDHSVGFPPGVKTPAPAHHPPPPSPRRTAYSRPRLPAAAGYPPSGLRLLGCAIWVSIPSFSSGIQKTNVRSVGVASPREAAEPPP